MVWKEGKREKGTVHLGQQKAAFDAELYVMLEEMSIATKKCREQDGTAGTIFMELYLTSGRIQLDHPRPGLAVALRTMRWESDILEKEISVGYRWVLAYMGITGNKHEDQHATKVPYMHQEPYTQMQNLMKTYEYIAFAYISGRITEMKWEESMKDKYEMGKKSQHSYQYNLVKR